MVLLINLILTWQQIGQLPGQPVAFVIKNETKAPLIVQVRSVVNGRVLRDRPCLIQPGESTPAIQVPGMKSLIISDGKNPARILAQIPLPNAMEEILIVISGGEGSFRLEARKPQRPAAP